MNTSQLTATQLIVMIFTGAFLFVLSGLPTIKTWQSELSPVLTTITSPLSQVTNKLDDVVRFVSDLEAIHSQNAALQTELANLQQQVTDLQTVKNQNTWLSSQLSLKQVKFDVGQLVPVMRYEYVPSPGYVYVYVGANSDVQEGYWATDYDYIVGSVVSVTGNYAKIKLISAPESTIPVKVGVDSTLGVLKGNLGIDAKVAGIAASADIKVNDQVFLADAGSTNLQKYSLGKVVEITGSDVESTKELKLKLPIDLLTLTYLVLVPDHV